MENINEHVYEEKFLFRSRKHILSEHLIRTQQTGFFTSSDITTRIEQLGYLLQYRADLQLKDVFISLVFFVIGIIGMSKGVTDSVAFCISIILIFTALYWTVSVLFNLKHIGSFYFSNSTEKSKNSFEIKSGYPPSEALKSFLQEIRNRQQTIAVENLMKNISADTDLKCLESEANYLRNTFSINEQEFSRINNKMIEIYQSLYKNKA